MMKKSLRSSLVLAALLLSSSGAFAQLGMVVAASSGKAAASSALLLASASASIKTCAFEARNEMLTDVESRLKTAGEAINGLEHEARSLTGEAREDFQSALRDVKAQEDVLRQSLRSSKRAKADEWPTERALLASSYGDYAGAVTRLEAAASSNPPK